MPSGNADTKGPPLFGRVIAIAIGLGGLPFFFFFTDSWAREFMTGTATAMFLWMLSFPAFQVSLCTAANLAMLHEFSRMHFRCFLLSYVFLETTFRLPVSFTALEAALHHLSSKRICYSFASFLYKCLFTFSCNEVRHGLVVRIAGSHPAGPGSIPGAGNHFFFTDLHILT